MLLYKIINNLKKKVILKKKYEVSLITSNFSDKHLTLY